MKRPAFIPLFFTALLSVCILACRQESGADQKELLLGRWEMQNATRDGGQAPSLDGLYFIFYEDGTLETNIAGSAETASYQLDGPVIQQRESRYEIDYAIEDLQDSLLILTTELRNASFRFVLRKKTAGE